MISLTCGCGKTLKVGDQFAGKIGRCPHCGKKIRIPGHSPTEGVTRSTPTEETLGVAPQQESPDELQALAAASAHTGQPTQSRRQQDRRGPARRVPDSVLPVALGFLMLTTVLIPWMVADGKVWMSWKLLVEAPGPIAAFLIGSWVIGLVAVAVGFSVRGVPAAVTYFILGGVGVILEVVLSIVAFSQLAISDAPFGSWAPVGYLVLLWLEIAFLVCLVITTHLRLRLGGRQMIRIIQAVAAGVLAVILFTGFILLLSGYTRSPLLASQYNTPYVMVGVASNTLLLTACVLALIHAVAVGIREPTLSKASLAIIYGILIATAVCLVIVIPLAYEAPEAILLMHNCCALIGAAWVLFCYGLIRSIAHFAPEEPVPRVPPQGIGTAPRAPSYGGPAPPPSVGAFPVDVAGAGVDRPEDRLRRLDSMRAEGTISEEEYAWIRQQILQEM